MIERVKTGIAGLDKALKGGIPEKNLVLIAGGAGTGKSTLCLQFLVNGATKFKEKGLYISTEQSREELIKQASGFGWDLEDLEKKDLLKIHYIDIVKKDNFLTLIKSLVKKHKPQRIVIDSMTTLTDYSSISDVSKHSPFSLVQVQEKIIPTTLTETIITKRILYNLFNQLRQLGATAFLTTELPEESKTLSADGLSEFICDGVLLLVYTGVAGETSRNLLIRKMRYTDHQKQYLPYDISSKGVLVRSEDALGVLMK